MDTNGGQKGLNGSAQPVPADAMLFRFPPSLAWFMFGASCVFLGFMAFVLGMQLLKPSHDSLVITLLCVVMCGSFATLGLRSFGRLRDSVAVSSEGIWYLPRKGEPTFIGWCDVASVKANDTQQRLVLTDVTGRRTIRLEYQLEGFGKLRDFVLNHTVKQTPLNVTGANIFHAIWINKGAMLGTSAICLFFAWLSDHNGMLGLSLFCIGYSFLALGVVALDPVRVVIDTDGVVVKYPLWERTILFGSIRGISFEDVNSRGNVWARVVIARQQGKPIKLRRFREGSVALQEALQAAWRSAGGPTGSSGDKAGVLK